MALSKRIIPCLDVKDGRVVKGVNFLGLRDAGNPVDVAKRYNDEGADELTFLDITASRLGRLRQENCLNPGGAKKGVFNKQDRPCLEIKRAFLIFLIRIFITKQRDK